jgi:catechol 2,3-dioxygenase-like lactoylglutathione lyase family enzyme
MDFIAADKEQRAAHKKSADLTEKAGAVHVYLSVDDVDAFHKELLAKGLKPAGEPRDWPSGNREFILRDPDGYNLVFFKRK